MKYSAPLNLLITVLITVLIVAVLTSCSGSTETSKTLDLKRPAPPAEYAGKANPLAEDAASVEAGKLLYAANCASCHGVEGMGDGPASASLNPKPMPLATEMDALKDDYLFWRISEGGAFSPFTSAMPAWKNIFTEDEIWQVVAFLRTIGK